MIGQPEIKDVADDELPKFIVGSPGSCMTSATRYQFALTGGAFGNLDEVQRKSYAAEFPSHHSGLIEWPKECLRVAPAPGQTAGAPTLSLKPEPSV
jgi:hypothetical protein